MTVFAVLYTYDDQVADRDRVRPEHRRFLADLYAAGRLLASGPFTGPTEGSDHEPDGALLLVRADDASAVRALLDPDPFAVAGLVAARDVRPWQPVFGPWD
ncbi:MULTISPECIES: YciI family protein [unclassified Actinotalea]|uniref:YciI family protein n=1 Tax=unclassified Actinotalea TaxID=2638618 RepID=UPI0015F3F274|nr:MULTISPECIES: YciI family protein [unclassified Actinotalea]